MDDALPTRPGPPAESASSTTPPVTRKRSHEEMDGKATKTQEPDSGTIVDNDDAPSTQIRQDKIEPSSLSSTIKSSGSSSSMLPPPLPASSSTSQKPPRSGQGSTASTQSSQPRNTQAKDVTDPPVAKQKADTDNDANGDDSTDDDDAALEPDSPGLSEPYERIQMFDWNDLQQRYHDKTSQLHNEEAGIMNEFHGLCDYFAVWAETGSTHETDRSFKRMKTQVTLVQHHEDQLEEKRLHYVKVVDAFKSALALLVK